MGVLSAEKALIFRITHIENVPWILTHGLCCRTSGATDPNFRQIGNAELIDKRRHRRVPIRPRGTLSDYVPFYFTPWSPMLYNIKTGYSVAQVPMQDIVIFVSSLHRIEKCSIPYVFSDRHAYLELAEFFNERPKLDRVDWALLNQRDFKRDHNDPGKFERYQAEALVHGDVPVTALHRVACYNQSALERVEAAIAAASSELLAERKPGWYF